MSESELLSFFFIEPSQQLIDRGVVCVSVSCGVVWCVPLLSTYNNLRNDTYKIKSLISHISTYYALEVKRVTQPSLFVYFSNSKIKLVGRSYVVWSNKLQHTAWWWLIVSLSHIRSSVFVCRLSTHRFISPLASPHLASSLNPSSLLGTDFLFRPITTRFAQKL